MKLKFLVLLLLCSTLCTALFEDQVGKFDWTARHVGCFHQIYFDRTESGQELLIVSTEKNVLARINVNNGDLMWRQINEANELDHPTFSVSESHIVTIMNNGANVRAFDLETGALEYQKPGVPNSMGTQNATAGILQLVENKVGAAILKLESFENHPGHFVAQSSQQTHIFKLNDGVVQILSSIDRANVFALAKSNAHSEFGSPTFFFAAYYGAQHVIRVIDLHSQKEVAHIGIGSTSKSPNEAPVKTMNFISSSSGSFQFLITRKDCQVDFFEAVLQRSDGETPDAIDASLEWVRFEGLASISAVEMVDLPLSESQARIETEFGSSDVPIWKSFFLRVSSQVEQLQLSFVGLCNRFVESFELMKSRRATATSVLKNLFGYDLRPSKKPRTATISLQTDEDSTLRLERDYFNLRKMIVATTLSGSVYGLSNDNGEVLWSLYLGDDFVKSNDQLGNPKLPLFIQRGTTFYQYPSQAAIVFNSQESRRTNILFFNPITGDIVNKAHVDNLKRVEMLPFVNSEMLQPLLILHDDETVEFYPALEQNYKPQYPVHLMSFDKTTGSLQGAEVDFLSRKLVQTWNSDLGLSDANEKIVAIAGKPTTQKIHSQGKVLGDRSVLYKYANPNLVAIVSADEMQSTLNIYLLDAVSGQVVYTARHARSQPPVNIVHCENWLVYTYWNMKARRTELGVIELYEGLEQTNAKHFNSYSTLKNPLTVFAQSYVFSQGVSAMAVSETEQGLTTRSIIIAMPFGGILEVSRRFVDARRPLELTPEMREEMIVPYMPELPIATEDLINYNQTVYNINGVKTFSSGLESTSLVFAFGLDLFYTRVTPSGAYDSLNENFDYLLITLVLVVLIIASFACKKIWRNQNLKQAWK